MRVLLAGATGAVGRPLTRRLVEAGHEVVGLTRNPASAADVVALGARPVVADVIDRDGLLRALDGVTADAVVHELTALKKMPTGHGDMAVTNELRDRGTAHLLDAARAVGATRFVVQSMIFGYGYGDWGEQVITEVTPFAPRGRGRFEEHIAAMRSAEHQVLTADGIDGIPLRYGLFYGPGAGLDEMVAMLRRRRLPVPRGGGGTASFVHIDDAAAATVAALERGQGGEAYNVVDDEPVTWAEFLGTVADAFGTPQPPVVPRFVLRAMPYAAAAMLGTYRVSNAKATAELGWAPAFPSCREGIRAAARAAAVT